MSNQSSLWGGGHVTPLQKIENPLLQRHALQLYVKRDDLLHPQVSGNKWRKLKYNFLETQRLGFQTILTFGGAYSNHIAATAAAGKATGIETIGIIRGHELTPQSNQTLALAQANGMKLIFVTREQYQDKDALTQIYGQNCYLMPEGGSNALAAKGVAEVVSEINIQLGHAPAYLATALGTGGTFAGLCKGAKQLDTQVLGFAALKNGQYLLPQIQEWAETPPEINLADAIFWDACGQGYGKTTPDLQRFVRDFEQQTGILLDPVYTAKMFFKLYQLIESGAYFPANSTIVALHTGGLQGRTPKLLGNISDAICVL